MGDVREIFSLPVDEDFVLSDHPTLNHFVAYIQKMTGSVVSSPAPVDATPVPSVAPKPEPEPVKESITVSDDEDIMP